MRADNPGKAPSKLIRARSAVVGALIFAVGCTPTPPTQVPQGQHTVSQLGEQRVASDPVATFTNPARRQQLASGFDDVEQYLASTVKRDNLVGLAAGIVIDGELAWFHAWGYSDPKTGTPITSDTRFGIGSITKTLTTLAVLKLRDEGHVQLDRAAARYLPELADVVYPTVDSPRITLRHILTHTSGLPRMGNFPEYPSHDFGREEFLATLSGLGLERAPGQRRVYSNLGFQLLGPLIQNVTWTDHRKYIQDAVLRPIGMGGATFRPEDVPAKKLAVGHGRGPDKTPVRRPVWRPGAADAAGGLYASVEDLAAYVAFNLNAWPPRNEADRGPVRRATLREAHTLQRLVNLHVEPAANGGAELWASGTGLAFAVFPTCRHPYVVGHNGKTLNYRASVLMLPHAGVGVILVSNQSGISSRILPADALKMLDILADTGGLTPREPAALPALSDTAQRVGALMHAWDQAVYTRTFSADYRDAHPVVDTRKELALWAAMVGPCESAKPVKVAEPRAGVVELSCARGNLRVDLRVAPWAASPVTSLRILGATGLPEPAEHRRAAEQVLKLMHHWDPKLHAQLFVPALGASRIESFLAHIRQSFGACQLDSPQLYTPNGVVYRLTCANTEADMRVELSSESPAKIGRFEITALPGTRRCGT